MGKALTTDALVGVDLGGEVWFELATACCGRLWVCSCGVWTWPVVFCVTQLNVDGGLPGPPPNGPDVGGLPRFLGLDSSIHRSINQPLFEHYYMEQGAPQEGDVWEHPSPPMRLIASWEATYHHRLHH